MDIFVKLDFGNLPEICHMRTVSVSISLPYYSSFFTYPSSNKPLNPETVNHLGIRRIQHIPPREARGYQSLMRSMAFLCAKH